MYRTGRDLAALLIVLLFTLSFTIHIRAGSTDRRNLPSSHFRTLGFFSICETKFGRVILHYNTNKRPGGLFLFLFFKAVRCILRPFRIFRQL